MGDHMSKVIPGLFVGSMRDAKDPKQIGDNKITHIVFIEQSARRGDLKDVEYLIILAQDSEEQNIIQFFPQVNDFVHGARVGGGNVLIHWCGRSHADRFPFRWFSYFIFHCAAGVSRSVTLTVAYLMSITELDSKAALRSVRGARQCASPNSGFIKQLHEFDGRSVRQERQRLKKKFGKLALAGDEEAAKQNIRLDEEHLAKREFPF